MPLISIETLTDTSVRNGSFTKILPELYKLTRVIEVQEWHDHQSVFDHSLKSVLSLDSIIEFDYLPDKIRTKLRAYLLQRIGRYSRIELLRVATLFHDIGKTAPLIRGTSGVTSFPNHGKVGGQAADKILQRFALSTVERSHITALITHHLVPSDLIEASVNAVTPYQDILKELRLLHPSLTPDLLLLAYADWLGCNIIDSVQDELEQRIAAMHQCLAHIDFDS